MNLTKIIKEEYKNLLKEVGDASAKSYDYNRIGYIDEDTIKYIFTTDLNTKYEVFLTEYDDNYSDSFGLYIDFLANNTIKIENKGELYKVMSTITKIIKEEIKRIKKNVYFITFYTKGKRHKLYDVYLKNYGFKKRKTDPESDSVIYFFNNNLNESEEDYKGEHEAPDREYGSPLHDVRDMFGKDFYDLSIDEIVRQFGSYIYYDRNLAYIIKQYYNKPNSKIKIYRAIPDFNKENTDKIKDLSSIIDYYDKFNFYPPSHKYKKLNDIVYEYENKIKNSNPDIEYDNLQKEIYENIWKDISELRSKKKKYEINAGDWVTIIRDYAVQHGKSEFKKYIILSKTVYADEIYTEGYMEEWGYDPRSNSKSLNESNNNIDDEIISYYDNIDRNPESEFAKNYINNLKIKHNHDYIPKDIRDKNDNEIVNKEVNKKYKTITNKGLNIYFITKQVKDNPTKIGITIYNDNNERIGGAGFNIDSFRKSIVIDGAIVYENYQRKSIYTKIVNYIQSIADKYNLNIVEGSRSSDAIKFWQSRLNK